MEERKMRFYPNIFLWKWESICNYFLLLYKIPWRQTINGCAADGCAHYGDSAFTSECVNSPSNESWWYIWREKMQVLMLAYPGSSTEAQLSMAHGLCLCVWVIFLASLMDHADHCIRKTGGDCLDPLPKRSILSPWSAAKKCWSSQVDHACAFAGNSAESDVMLMGSAQ